MVDLTPITFWRSKIISGMAVNLAIPDILVREDTNAMRFLISLGADIRSVRDIGEYTLYLVNLDFLRYIVALGADNQVAPDPVNWGVVASHKYVENVSYSLRRGTPHRHGRIRRNVIRFMQFCGRMELKFQRRATRQMYFWWLPRYYDLARRSGRRARARNFREYRRLGVDA